MIKGMIFLLVCCLMAGCTKDSLPPAPVPATVSITGISAITSHDAYITGQVSDNGGGVILEQGICWATHENPTLSDAHVISGTSNSYFTEHISGLSPATTYYVSAYAVNKAGTSFGPTYYFKTTN